MQMTDDLRSYLQTDIGRRRWLELIEETRTRDIAEHGDGPTVPLPLREQRRDSSLTSQSRDDSAPAAE
jgi:hypothetical protein